MTHPLPLLLLLLLSGTAHGLWFEDLVTAQTAYVRAHYPVTHPDTHPLSLLEACGGVGAIASPFQAGACAPGNMSSVDDITYVRLVFTPFNATAPTVLVLYNRSDPTKTTFVAKDEPCKLLCNPLPRTTTLRTLHHNPRRPAYSMLCPTCAEKCEVNPNASTHSLRPFTLAVPPHIHRDR